MLLTVIIAIILASAIGAFFLRSPSNINAAAAKQTHSPLIRPLQAKTGVETALEFETYKQKKEAVTDAGTSINSLHEMQENHRKFVKQYRDEFEKLKTDIQSGWTQLQKENQIHTVKANEKVQDWVKSIWNAQRIQLQEFVQIANDKTKQEIQSEIQSAKQDLRGAIQNTEQHIQREIKTTRQFVKEEIQKTWKALSKPLPKATTTESSKESIDFLEKQLDQIEMTENQLQTNIFNELNYQLTDAQNAMAQIQSHLEMLHLLSELECEFKDEALPKSE